MSAPVELHVTSRARTVDGVDCARCGAVLSVGPEAGFGHALVAMPDGHYTSARVATPDDLATGVLCEPRPRGITLDLGGRQCTVRREGVYVEMIGFSADMALPLSHAKALCQALRETIGQEPAIPGQAYAAAQAYVDAAERARSTHPRLCTCAGCRAAAGLAPKPSTLGATER